jgi:hypothetical protein
MDMPKLPRLDRRTRRNKAARQLKRDCEDAIYTALQICAEHLKVDDVNFIRIIESLARVLDEVGESYTRKMVEALMEAAFRLGPPEPTK